MIFGVLLRLSLMTFVAYRVCHSIIIFYAKYRYRPLVGIVGSRLPMARVEEGKLSWLLLVVQCVMQCSVQC